MPKPFPLGNYGRVGVQASSARAGLAVALHVNWPLSEGPHHLLQEIAVPKRFAAGGGAVDDVNIIPHDTWASQEHGEPCSVTPKVRVEIGDALIRHIHPAHDVIVIINHRGYFNFRRRPPPPRTLNMSLAHPGHSWSSTRPQYFFCWVVSRADHQHVRVVDPTSNQGTVLVDGVSEVVEHRGRARGKLPWRPAHPSTRSAHDPDIQVSHGWRETWNSEVIIKSYDTPALKLA